jgi:hypothetical protein
VKAEAAALIRSNIEIVQALVEALDERRILSGHEIDAIVAREVAARALADERAAGRLEDCREKRG